MQMDVLQRIKVNKKRQKLKHDLYLYSKDSFIIGIINNNQQPDIL